MPRVIWEHRIAPKNGNIWLWLDDERPMPSAYTHLAKTATEAIDIIKSGQVVVVSLDHDLGDGCGTGYEVAKYIEENAVKGMLPPIRCYVHSMNVVGQKNIKIAIRNAYRAWHSMQPDSCQAIEGHEC